jgi:threonine dehydrogenase-like Zn-dependent dehydrogenase
MKVSMWYNNQDMRLEEIPTPEPSNGEMLVKVHACGICGSDIVEYRGTVFSSPPRSPAWNATIA